MPRNAGPHARRGFAVPVVLLTTAALVLALTACGGGGEAAPSWDARSVAESAADAPFIPIVANSNLGVGETRFAIGLIANNLPVDGADITARLYRLGADTEADPRDAEQVADFALTARSLVSSTPHQHADGTVHDHTGIPATIYVANTSFDRAGPWGVALDIAIEGRTYRDVLVPFFVDEHTDEPAVGDSAPATVQQLAGEVADIAEIDSSLPPHPELHQITVADAITSGRPTLVAFVTPSFCQTAFCGPVMDNVILPSYQAYGDRVNIVHIEPYDLPSVRAGSLVLAPASVEWNLVSEPAVFILDADGIVTAKFEGIMELEEVTAAIEDVLGG